LINSTPDVSFLGNEKKKHTQAHAVTLVIIKITTKTTITIKLIIFVELHISWVLFLWRNSGDTTAEFRGHYTYLAAFAASFGPGRCRTIVRPVRDGITVTVHFIRGHRAVSERIMETRGGLGAAGTNEPVLGVIAVGHAAIREIAVRIIGEVRRPCTAILLEAARGIASRP
jgi:hypothetical protein